jgi:hypothetical protein
LGAEDEILIGYIYGLLEEEKIDPKLLQINLMSFLEEKTESFLTELWELFISAQNSKVGIPQLFLDEEKEKQLQRLVFFFFY